ncbi:Cof-type HAD-IIB family hydrolase [Allosaccharopolyspora coralli]|uniref:Cof-type HAD-IIB family hydrolase n=1 Tax=Allosaccharopolyspora coralli TaxID=2665642 RepID=A0A5Q3Q9I0_9PSEU|nr:Cof-type HAD-IIB family hydrolase [Allosaccharopolyspora coralli]QGK70006.1 Cof-type HAD-IIB family hydrolase [Allosaccharopolyspora coralli]
MRLRCAVPDEIPGIDLIGIDLDGTSLNSQRQMTATTQAAIDLTTQIGVDVVIITGRPVRECRDLARQYNLDIELVASNGAATWDAHTGTVLRRDGFTPAWAHQLVSKLRRCSSGLRLGVVDDDVCALDVDFPEDLARSWHMEPTGCVEQAVARHRTSDPVQKIVAWHPDGRDYAITIISQAGVSAELSYSGSEFVELTAPGVHKGSALQTAAAGRGYSLGRCAAIGDMPNDIPMLQAAGVPLAMGNAHPTVFAHATYVLPSQDSHGVAAALHAIIRGAKRPQHNGQ